MQKILAVANHKGGVGKTTTAMCLAQALGRKYKTVLLDADEITETARGWYAGSGGSYAGWKFDMLPFEEVQHDPGRLTAYERIVVDTKGSERDTSFAALGRSANLIIVPTKADGQSVLGIRTTLASVAEQGVQDYRVLILDVPAHPSNVGLQLQVELVEAGVPVFAQMIRHAVAISKAALDGVSVEDVRGDRAAKTVALEYQKLAQEVEAHAR